MANKFLAVMALLLLVLACEPGTPNDEEPTGEPVMFDLTGAVALAMIDPAEVMSLASTRALNSGVSNLRRVEPDGSQTEALSSGQATVSHFLVAPSGRIYIVFEQKTDLETSTLSDAGYILAEVDPATGEPVGIDSDLASINWPSDQYRVKNYPVQFDAVGAIYYAGTTPSGTTVLRRHHTDTRDYINDNVHICDFLVEDDATVYVSGLTLSTNKSWIRRIAPTDAVTQLLLTDDSEPCTFMQRFPDDRIYFGFWGSGNRFGTFILLEDDSFDERPWISGASVNELTYEPYNDVTPFEPNGGFWGTMVKQFYQTVDSKVFAITSDKNILLQYYPALSQPQTVVTNVSLTQGVLSDIVLAGVDDSYANRLVVYHTSSDTEVELLDAYDIEIYHLQYVAADNKILFDGLDFSNNQYVIGQVDLGAGNEVLLVPTTGNVQYEELQTL